MTKAEEVNRIIFARTFVLGLRAVTVENPHHGSMIFAIVRRDWEARVEVLEIAWKPLLLPTFERVRWFNSEYAKMLARMFPLALPA